MENIYDLIIIGAGPAGMSASIYASKAKLKTLLIERDYPGGKIVKTATVENWPGESSIEGYDLATKMFEHSTSFGAEYVSDKIIKIVNNDYIKEVIGEYSTYYTKAIIIATGTKERKIGIPGEDKFYGKGVSYCAICDGSLYKDKEMVVIGGGNSALQETLYLTNFAKHIFLVHRRDTFRAEQTMIDEVMENDKIDILLNHQIREIKGEDVVDSVVLEDTLNKTTKTINTSVVFPFIGSDPESKFIKDLNISDENGYINVDDHLSTSIPGIYAAGDVIKKELRQIVTAANDGALAATNIYHYIKDLDKKNKK